MSAGNVVSLPTATVNAYGLDAQIGWMEAKHKANHKRRSELMAAVQMPVHVADREDLMELRVIDSLKALQAMQSPARKAVG